MNWNYILKKQRKLVPMQLNSIQTEIEIDEIHELIKNELNAT